MLAQLDALLAPLGLSSGEAGGTVSFAGEEPLFASAVPLASAFALAAMAAAVAAAALGRERGLPGQDLHVDLREAAHGINPELTFHPTLNGHPYPNPHGQDQPYMFTVIPYRTRDGRWVYPAAVYPHQQSAWLRYFDCGPEPARIARRIAGRGAQELEDEANALGHTLCIARTPEEWAAHPQGQYLSGLPVISVTKTADGPPVKLPSAERPLTGVRVLSATHAIAGPTVGRTLAEQGADVLHVSHPHHFEHDWVYNEANVGQRSAFLDLKSQAAPEADVAIDSFRGRRVSLEADIRVTVRCYGWDGPWRDRGGFDMLGTAASGLAHLEGDGEKPSMPPTGLINDFVTGYLGAAGATAALLRRAREGGRYQVDVSLTRTAMWCQELGVSRPPDFAPNYLRQIDTLKRSELPLVARSLCLNLRKPAVLEADTPLGRLRRLAPAISFSHTPGRWEDPILVPRGSSRLNSRESSARA